jgi:uncharacterized protein
MHGFTQSKIRQILILIVLVFLIVSGVVLTRFLREKQPEIPIPADPRAQTGLPVAQIKTAENLAINAEIVWLEPQREKGLMFRTSVPPGTGMLFVFDNEGYRDIWMKNTWVDLDVVFIGENKQITSIAHNIKASDPKFPDRDPEICSGYGKYCLEIAAGESVRLHLTKNSQLLFDLTPIF